jgi:hypothetical protein
MPLALGKEIVFVEKQHPGAKGGQCKHIFVQQKLPDEPEHFHGYKYPMQQRRECQSHCPHLHKKKQSLGDCFF